MVSSHEPGGISDHLTQEHLEKALQRSDDPATRYHLRAALQRFEFD